MIEQLQQAVKDAARIRDESWVEETSTYSIDLREACDKACESVGFDLRATQAVWLLLFCCWNDALSWAEGG